MLEAKIQVLKDFSFLRDEELRHIFNIDSGSLLLADLKVVLFAVEEVSDLLVVDLNEGHFYAELNVLIRGLNVGEDRAHYSRNDALQLGVVNLVFGALHRKGLARACLAIGKDRPIETLEHA